jgi:hypothetical protein
MFRPDTDESFIVRGTDESGVSFVGDEAVRAFRDAVNAIAASALAHGGWHENAVDALVTEACRIARDTDEAIAISHVERALGAELRVWRVAEPIFAHVFNRVNLDPVRVGRCFLSMHASFWASPDASVPDDWLEEFRPKILVTEVEAHDDMSARWRASEACAEAKAILFLMSGAVPFGVLPPQFVVADDGGLTVHSDTGPTLIVHHVLEDGSFWDGYQYLSDAAAKDPLDRTDWEMRCIGAARWHYRGHFDSWPAGALVAAMSAIEILLCLPTERDHKDRRIARRLIEYGARIRGVPETDREKWFRRLYGRWRNNAIHDARFYADERDIERVAELSRAVLRWAVQHLDPHHNASGGACATIEDALADHDS